MSKRQWLWFVAGLVVVAALIAAGVLLQQRRVEKGPEIPVAPEILQAARPLAQALPLPELEMQAARANSDYARVFVALHDQGKELGQSWAKASTVEGALALAYSLANSKVSQPPTQAIVAVAGEFDEISSSNRSRKLSNIHRGVLGLAREDKANKSRHNLFSPTLAVSRNLEPEKQLELFAKEEKTTPDALIKSGRLYTFNARQFFVDLKANRAQELLRGNVVVRPEEVTLASTQALATRLSRWMLANVMPDGRMVYQYYPSGGTEGRGNNTIRQLMATVCLDRIARGGEFPEATEVALRNLRYNIKTFYREREGLGSVEFDGSSKLGAIALMALSIMESPERSEFQTQEAALRRAMDALWQPNGRFKTFLFPKERDDNHNFYPGEALLTWAFSYKEKPLPELRQKIEKSYLHYKDWHLANRNPAFIPWHTQAYYLMLEQADDAELRKWVFEMNDWLLGMQERSRVEYDDTLGRFYDPTHPAYGPPHASSTGVYLEGLIDAFLLARRSADVKRAEAYRRSILLGLRDAMQLEFADDIDMFYVENRKAVAGGLRTTVYNNVIRVDNVQHVLMAVQKILKGFQPSDYAAVK